MSEFELSQDEFTVLLIAVEGESMIPIGRWKAPILALTERGLMRKNDDVNYEITAEGRKACEQRNEEDDRDLRRLLEGNSKTIEARANEEPQESDDVAKACPEAIPNG